jgi:hypothetical protein
MAEPVRHRQTKGAETDMLSLPPPRHISTLPGAVKLTASICLPNRPRSRTFVEGAGRFTLSTSVSKVSAGSVCCRDPCWKFRAVSDWIEQRGQSGLSASFWLWRWVRSAFRAGLLFFVPRCAKGPASLWWLRGRCIVPPNRGSVFALAPPRLAAGEDRVDKTRGGAVKPPCNQIFCTGPRSGGYPTDH